MQAQSAQLRFNVFDDLVNGAAGGGGIGGLRNGTLRGLSLSDMMDNLQQFTDPLLFGAAAGAAGAGRAAGDGPFAGAGRARSSGGPFFGFGGFGSMFGGAGGGGASFRGGPAGAASIDPESLRGSTDPLTGPEFQAFIDAITANVDAASITSQLLNLASGIVYTVSGALGTVSVSLSLVPAIPAFFFGLFNLEGLRENFQGLFLDEIIDVLARINALRQRIRSGAFIQQLEEQLKQVQTVRAMLRDLRENNPIGSALQRAAASAQAAGAAAAAGDPRGAAAALRDAQQQHQAARDKWDEVTANLVQLKLGGPVP
ncbi:hypothetical protein PLESTB_000926100 [Pleodorina starrii]|uniref:Uncharacterized protein n=1 Tax=Pleodorina starrii TaxID=330485 RepID=A0A9W6BNE2_9CHLO|nr:hypothetical protein PLESTB_000926100 [Pleodorina starrii]